MAKSEQRIMQETLIAVSAEPATMVWRNNTGTAWQGQRVNRAPGATIVMERGMCILREARPIAFGLEGSPDVIGVSAGRAIGLELKSATGQIRGAQALFRRAWMAAGGVYGVPRSAEEALRILRGE